MKRKLLFTIVLCLFAGLTVLNIGLANKPASSDTTLDLISVMVKAFDEGGEEIRRSEDLVHADGGSGLQMLKMGTGHLASTSLNVA